MAGTSPECVIKAYYEQFQKDFMAFMKCRSKELVDGGNMVLTLLGRRNGDASSRDGCYIWELMAMAIRQMVSEASLINYIFLPHYMSSGKYHPLHLLTPLDVSNNIRVQNVLQNPYAQC